MTRTRWLWIALCLILTSGCVTEEKVISGVDLADKGWELDTTPLEQREKLEKELFLKFWKNPQDPATAWRIGMYYYANRDYVRAEYWFRYALERSPKLKDSPGAVRYYYLIAESCLWQGKIQDAMQFFQKVLAVKQPIKPMEVEFPEYKKSHFYLGLLYFYLGEEAKAQPHFRRYIELGGSPEDILREKERLQISRRFSSSR